MLSDIGSVLAGLLALAIILMGLRYSSIRIRPPPGSAFPAPAAPLCLTARGLQSRPRGIAIGVALAALLIDGAHRQLGYLMLAAATVPIADGTIVLRSGGRRAIALGIHWATAAVMLTVTAFLIA